MPRRDELYLADVVEACQDIVRFLADLSLDDWLQNDLVRYAVLQRLTVVGEAARRLSPETQSLEARVPWRLTALGGDIARSSVTGLPVVRSGRPVTADDVRALDDPEP